jgi:peptide/nickel transport system substrate-binding protein
VGRNLARSVVGICLIVVLGCGQSTGREGSSPSTGAPPPVERHRVVIAVKNEPTGLASRPLVTNSSTPSAPGFLFNATLTQVDEHGAPVPELAEALPELNTASWQVFADGRMETTYRVRPGITWHDGTPLTPQDFVFAWRAYTTQEIGAVQAPPVSLMEDVSAEDGTLRIRWSRTYAEADSVAGGRYGLPPLPRHILEPIFTQGPLEAFINHPYWSSEFVGAGPFRLERWEPGAYVDGFGFAGYVGGAPIIDRIRMVAVSDPSAAVARVLAGELDMVIDGVLGIEQGGIVASQWRAGRVFQVPNNSRYAAAQFKPEYANQAQTDLRVRRALMYAVDRVVMSESLLDGVAAVAHTTVGPGVEYFDAVDRAVTKYPYDLRAAQTLLNDAGYVKSGDFYTDSSGRPLTIELWAYAGAPGDSEVAILTDAWKRAGIDIVPYLVPAARAQDLELVSTHPGLRIDQTPFEGDTPMAKAHSARIATAANRWSGSNRGGYSNAEFDGLMTNFQGVLARPERAQAAVAVFKFLSDQLPLMPFYYSPRPVAVASALRGVNPGPRDVAYDQVTKWTWAP